MATTKTKTATGKGKPAAKKPPAAKTGGETAAYTKPELRERLKKRVTAGDKGGRPGQWSARKAQLLATEYKKEGGGYKAGPCTKEQKHLETWTAEKWKTADGTPAARGKTMARYLPKKAWEELSPAEKKATEQKKQRASRTGKQFVANTGPAKKARKSAAKS